MLPQHYTGDDLVSVVNKQGRLQHSSKKKSFKTRLFSLEQSLSGIKHSIYALLLALKLLSLFVRDEVLLILFATSCIMDCKGSDTT